MGLFPGILLKPPERRLFHYGLLRGLKRHRHRHNGMEMALDDPYGAIVRDEVVKVGIAKDIVTGFLQFAHRKVLSGCFVLPQLIV
jgi:hypothetical protein